jgi:hypothetical protein
MINNKRTGFDLQLCATEKGIERKMEAENVISLLVSYRVVLVDEDIGVVLEDSLDGLEERISQHTQYRRMKGESSDVVLMHSVGHTTSTFLPK